MLVYVHAHFKNADPTKILNIFQEMEEEGLSPDGVSFTHLFHYRNDRPKSIQNFVFST